MIILGVDPGSRVTGYGLIDVAGNHISCVEFGGIAGIIKGHSNLFPDRLHRIHSRLRDVAKRHAPAVMAVEDIFHSVNAKSALKLGQARGVVLLVAGQFEIPLVEYTPLEIKKAVVGYGRASKEQIQMMVRTLLNLRQEPQPHDAADALAVALCHAFKGTRTPYTRLR
ncbi:MAG: crossover junction endodeoxyribonuclease RuvC [Acidobacteria bacterium]|nr:crossover junction endodeoxyribonuclease RuvC [Acidobacteriota bacterium]